MVSSIVVMLTTSFLIHVDIGFGDYWHASLPNGYYLSSIDLEDNGSIRKDTGEWATGVGSLSIHQLQVLGDTVVGQCNQKEYFLLDTKSNKLETNPSTSMLKAKTAGHNLDLMNNESFYWETQKPAYLICGQE